MALCESINKSRNEHCKTGFSGVQAVGFLPKVNGGLTLTASDMFEGTGLTGSVYKFFLKNDANTYSEEIASDTNTGTTVYTGTLTLTLPVLDRETRDQVKLLAMGQSHIFIEMYDGKKLLMGSEFGAYLTGGTIATGGARTDMSGYTLTLTSMERRPIVFVDATGSTAYSSAINLTGMITPQ